jgi:hypothetical protein
MGRAGIGLLDLLEPAKNKNAFSDIFTATATPPP